MRADVEIARGDTTELWVGAMVNAANGFLLGGSEFDQRMLFCRIEEDDSSECRRQLGEASR